MSPPWSWGFPWNHCRFTDPTISAMSTQCGVHEKATSLFLDNCKSMRKHKSQERVFCNSAASACLEINYAFEALLRSSASNGQLLRKPGTRKYLSALFIHSTLVKKKSSPWILHSLLLIEWTEVRTVMGESSSHGQHAFFNSSKWFGLKVFRVPSKGSRAMI